MAGTGVFPTGGSVSGQGEGSASIVQYTPDQILLMKDIRPDIIMQVDDARFLKNSILSDIMAMGREETTTTTELYHYETGSYFATAEVLALTSATADSVIVEYTASSMNSSGGVVTSPGNVGDIVILGNDKFTAVITSKNVSASPHKITLTRGTGNTSGALNDTSIIAVGDTLSFPYSVQAAGEAFPDGTSIRDTRYQNYLQYMMTSTPEIEADLANQELYISLSGQPGTNYMINRYDVALTVRHAVKKGYAMLFSDGSTYNATMPDGSSKAIQTTVGLYPSAEQFATKYAIAPGFLDIDDIYNFATNSAAVSGSNENIVYIGPDRKNEWDSIFRSDFQNGAVVYANPTSYEVFANKTSATGAEKLDPKGAAEQALSLGYRSVNVKDINFHTKVPTEFYNPKIVNVPGKSRGYYATSMLIIPATNGTTTFNRSQTQGISFGIKTRLGLNRFDGSRSKIRLYNQAPENFGSERFKKTFVEEFGLTTHNAVKYILVTK